MTVCHSVVKFRQMNSIDKQKINIIIKKNSLKAIKNWGTT